MDSTTRHDRIAATHIDRGAQRLYADEDWAPTTFWDALNNSYSNEDFRGFRLADADLSREAFRAIVDIYHGGEPVVSSLIAEEVLDYLRDLPDFYAPEYHDGIAAVRAAPAE